MGTYIFCVKKYLSCINKKYEKKTKLYIFCSCIVADVIKEVLLLLDDFLTLNLIHILVDKFTFNRKEFFVLEFL